MSRVVYDRRMYRISLMCVRRAVRDERERMIGGQARRVPEWMVLRRILFLP